MADYSKYMDGVDDVQETYGFSHDPLPRGQYPLEVVDIQDQGETEAGVPFAKAQLAVMEGPHKNRRVFETVYFGAAMTKGMRDGDQWVRIERTPEEFAKANRQAIGRAKGWIKALGLTMDAPSGDGVDAVLSMYRVNQWQGCRLMADVGIRKDNNGNEQNNVTGFCSVDDPKKGLSKWRDSVLPRQVKASERESGGGGAAATSL